MRKFIENVSFGSDVAKNTFKDLDAMLSSSKDQQLAAFGRQFPQGASKGMILKRIADQEAAMKAWTENLKVLKQQVVINDLIQFKSSITSNFTSEEVIKMLGYDTPSEVAQPSES